MDKINHNKELKSNIKESNPKGVVLHSKLSEGSINNLPRERIGQIRSKLEQKN